MSRMIYKAPGPHKLHGVMVEHQTIADDEKAPAGWHENPLDAQEAMLKSEVANLPKKRGRKPKNGTDKT